MAVPAPIAVVGVAFRLPGGANDLDSLEELLHNGRSGYVPVPQDRWNSDAFYSTQPNARGAIASKGGYFLQDDISKFDAKFFNIASRNEAASMDPKQRLLLQTTYEALENAGIPMEDIKGSDTSVHVSTFTYDYERMGYRDTQVLSGSHVTGSGPAILSNRISYFFDLKGPSFTLDTGCSGGLVAVHQACQSLRLGECSTAIAAGAQLLIDPDQSVNMNSLGMINADGHCYAFDSRGTGGYGRGEGIASLILKPMDKAIADGDHIHTIILNSGIGQDGRSAGSIMSPDGAAQRDLMQQIYREAGLDPSHTNFVEAHGTGTAVGDQQEISSIHQVFTESTQRTSDLIVGSIKANVGHLEASAGLAGLLKAILVLKTGTVPPQVRFDEPKAGLDLLERKIYVPKELVRLPEGLRRASVNSFGYGGTNSHVIIESLESYNQRRPYFSRLSNGFPDGLRHHSPTERINPSTRHLGVGSNGHLLTNGITNGDAQHRPPPRKIRSYSHTNGVSERPNGHSQTYGMFETHRHANGLPNGKSHTNGLPDRHPQTDRLLNGHTLTNGSSNGHTLANGLSNGHAHTNGASKEDTTNDDRSELFLLSAESEKSLKSLEQKLRDWITIQKNRDHRRFRNLSYSLMARRSLLSWRRTIVASSFDGLSESLGRPRPVKRASPCRTAFIFTGQGAQWAGMGRELFAVPPFHQSICKSEQLLLRAGCPWKLSFEMFAHEDSSRLSEAELAQPATTALQIALVDLLSSLGVEPSCVVGHSSGEIAAAYAAGALSHAAAIEAAYHRGVHSARAKRRNELPGAMLAVGLGEAEVAPYLTAIETGRLCVACVNSPKSTTVSGDGPAIDELKQALDAKSIFARKLKVDTAYHSHHMQVIAEEYRASLRTIRSTTPRCAFFSSVTASQKHDDFRADYWVQNLVSPVRFSDGLTLVSDLMKDLAAAGNSTTFIEIGPTAALAGPSKQTLASGLQYSYLSALTRKEDARATFLALVGQLIENGYKLDRKAIWDMDQPHHLPKLISNLPAYPFDESSYWSESRQSAAHRFRRFGANEFCGLLDPTGSLQEPRWTHHLSLDSLPWLKDHVIDGDAVFPASGYIAMAIEAMRQLRLLQSLPGTLATFLLDEITFSQAISFPLNDTRAHTELQLTLTPSKAGSRWYSFRFLSISDGDGTWIENCSGLIAVETTDEGDEVEEHREHDMDIEAQLTEYSTIQGESNESIDHDDLYQRLEACGNQYGQAFALLQEVKRSTYYGSAALNSLDVAMHPGTLDSVIHIATLISQEMCSNASMVVGKIDDMVISADILDKAGANFRVGSSVNPQDSRTVITKTHVLHVQPEGSLMPVMRMTHTLQAFKSVSDANAAGGSARKPPLRVVYKRDVDLLTEEPMSAKGVTSLTTAQDESDAYSGLSVYLESLAFKYSQLKVLQLGAPSSMTLPVLTKLSKDDSSLWVERYDIAENDNVALEATKSQLAPWAAQVQLRTLDIRQDTAQQGLETTFDVVIAGSDILSDPASSVSLTNCRNLLRSGGRLVVIQSGNGVPFENYDQMLSCAGFGRIERRIPGNSTLSMVIASAIDAHPTTGGSRTLKVISGTQSDSTRALATTLNQHFSTSAEWMVSNAELDGNYTESGIYVVLDSAEDPLLIRQSKDEFMNLQKLLTAELSVLWVSLRESSTATATSMGSMIRGAARVLRRENGGNSPLSIFEVDEDVRSVDIHKLSEQLARILSKSLVMEHEYFYRNGQTSISRLQVDHCLSSWINRRSGDRISVTDARFHQPGRPLQLEVAVSGLLNSMRFTDDASSSEPLEPSQIQISSRAHGVNFKDVFISLGQMPPSVKMVGEVAGVVTAVGNDMQHRYQVGDRVTGFFAKPFASMSRLHGDLAHSIPSEMDFPTAATIPCIYATAYHCLFEVARFSKGQTVLITAASGGVGQAAIQLAQHAGASEIFVTLGSASKKKLIMDTYGIPESHIFSSKKLHFRDGIRRLTKGRGVDVVINSLTDPSLSAAFDCVAKLGTFCEIGKGDIYKSSHLKLKPFDRSITFAAVDLVVVGEHRPDIIQRHLAAIMDLFKKAAVRAVSPINVFGIQEIETAFRLISGRKHTGKVVLESGEESIVKATLPPPAPLQLSAEGVYVVAGGLGGIGKHLTTFLADKGAGHIVLLSRRKLSQEDANKLADEAGIPLSRLHVLQCDITQAQQVAEIAEHCRTQLGPVRGVICSAMLLRDRPFSTMSQEEWLAPLAPKLYGTINLNHAFASPSLDFFVMLSSSATVIGNGSQSNYTAANAFQDGFARAQANHPHTSYVSLNLGAVEDTAAIASTSQAQTNRLKSISMTINEVLQSLEYAMSSQSRQDGCVQPIMGVSRQALIEADDNVCLTDPFFSRLPRAPQELEGATSKKRSDVKADIKAAKNMDAVKALVLETLREKCASFLDRSKEEVPVNLPLADIGFDSLVSIELKNWIIRTLEATVQTAQISSAPSITALATTIAGRSKLVSDEAKQKDSAEVVEDVKSMEDKPSEFQCCLVQPPPKLPLPTLDTYLNAYIESVGAFCYTERELDMIREAVESYRAPNAIGRTLYQALEKRANDSETDVWYTNPETLSLLTFFRHPNVPYNVFVHTHHDSDRPHGQAERAALISTVAFQFLQGMKRNAIDHDWLGPRPLCSYSWLWMFSSTREPRVWCDKMQMYDSCHVAVLRKGHLFKVPLQIDGNDVSMGSLQAAFQSILDLPIAEKERIGIMTTDFRDEWAVNRQKLLDMSSGNVEYFRAIEEATFVVCLDEGSPITPAERISQATLGTGLNRFFDKTTQFVVSKNGRSAHIAEHTMVDGTTPLRLTEYIHDAIMSHTPNANGANDTPAPFEGFDLQTTPEIDAHVERLCQRYQRVTANKGYRYFKTPILSHAVAAGSGIPAKSCLDLAIQLAGRLHFDRNVATWEPVSMQHFHKGRPEIMQTLDESVVGSFCDAAVDDNVALSVKKSLMREASATWQKRGDQHRDGNGFLRRSEALLGILASHHRKQESNYQPISLTEEEAEAWGWPQTFAALLPESAELPSMYTNVAFQRMYPGDLYHVLNEGEFADASAFVMQGALAEQSTAKSGKVWISKKVRQSHVSLSISGDVDDIRQFEESFKKASQIIREIIEKG